MYFITKEKSKLIPQSFQKKPFKNILQLKNITIEKIYFTDNSLTGKSLK